MTFTSSNTFLRQTFRPAWEDGFGDACENVDDDTYDLDRVSIEEVFVEEDREVSPTTLARLSLVLITFEPFHASVGHDGNTRFAEFYPRTSPLAVYVAL